MITLPIRDGDSWLLRSVLNHAYIDCENRAATYFRFATQHCPNDAAYWLKLSREATEQMRVCHDALAI